MLIVEMALMIGISSMEMKNTEKCECGFGKENVSEKKSCDFSMLKIKIDNNIFVLFIKCSIYSALTKALS